MARTTMSVFLLVCGVVGLACGGTIYKDLNITTPESTYSNGTHAAGSGGGGAPPNPNLICPCGTNTACKWTQDNTTPECVCATGYIGSPPKCQPGPELWNLCFKDNSCGLHSECEVEDGTRSCPSCLIAFEGSPPYCRTPEKCRDENVCGPNAECEALFFLNPCSCIQGFVGTPPNCRPGPALLARCNPYPCGAYADCRLRNGGPVCSCSPGYDGTPPHCTPGPVVWRVCFKDKPCGAHSRCRVVDRMATCAPCDEGYRGEPPDCY